MQGKAKSFKDNKLQLLCSNFASLILTIHPFVALRCAGIFKGPGVERWAHHTG